jgi:hypothetical protein
MIYENDTIMKAFDMYTMLARDGYVPKNRLQEYLADEHVRSLVDQFARKVECEILLAGDQLYMIPVTKLSPFHVDNEHLRRTYVKGNATNADLYLLYFATIILIGCFYDSYHTLEATRSFIQLDEWVQEINKRVDMLKEHPEEKLKEWEKEFSYNWRAIIEKWEAMDDIKETAKKQTGNTISRLSFVDMVKRFLIDQEIVCEIGNHEITITEKTKTIVQRFFMDLEYNRGILEFLYQFERGRGGEKADADHM